MNAQLIEDVLLAVLLAIVLYGLASQYGWMLF